ncbi:hypothetical protein QBC36DRAFT_368045 [Triangularia setosa]|uniref:Uncharacterized protein n=1 Tax=Triangularia setosa TaxID=2587417 RepID=A0AAN7A2U1_9PEZI|nr:hypothetical protein QBC36DRAFT_368045 [Podospora setosa]
MPATATKQCGNLNISRLTPKLPSFDSPRVAQPPNNSALPNEPAKWPNRSISQMNESNKHYDKNNLESNVRHVCSDADPVLAPSDFWKMRISGNTYTSDETIIDIFIERSLQRGLKKRFKDLKKSIGRWWAATWKALVPCLGRRYPSACSLFTKKLATSDSAATEARKLQRSADAGVYSRTESTATSPSLEPRYREK